MAKVYIVDNNNVPVMENLEHPANVERRTNRFSNGTSPNTLKKVFTRLSRGKSLAVEDEHGKTYLIDGGTPFEDPAGIGQHLHSGVLDGGGIVSSIYAD
jgi:hypothetical protein